MKFSVRLAALCVIYMMCIAEPTFAQSGAWAPSIRPTFFNASGAVAGNGFVCTTVTGSNTSLLTFQDPTLVTPNQNPIRLNAAGRAVNGSNEVSIFIQPKTYRFTIYAAGTGNTCNGNAVGSILNQIDNVFDLASLFIVNDKACHTAQQTGVTLDLRITACLAILPSTGGVIDAIGDQGSQTYSACPWTGVSKPTYIRNNVGTTSIAVNCTVPSNVTYELVNGSILSPNTGITLTINGPLIADNSQHFAGAGTVALNNSISVVPLWFPGSDPGAQINAAVSAMPSAGGVIDARGFQGAQSIAATITLSKPIKLLLGATTFTCANTVTFYCINVTAAGGGVECVAPTTTTIAVTPNIHGVNVASGTFVRNCTLLGNNAASVNTSSGVNGGTSTGVLVENNVFNQWATEGVNSGGSSPNWIIRGNTFTNILQDAIFYPSNNGVIEGNVFKSIQSNCVDLGGGSSNTVSHNNMTQCGLGTFVGGDCWAILFTAGSYNVAVGNVIQTTRCQGIIIKAAASVTNFNTVTGNTVQGGTGATADGISLDGSSSGTCEGNTISGNTVSGNARIGIIVDGSVGTMKNNIISNNTVENNTSLSIEVAGANALDNLVSDNIMRGNGTDVVTLTSSVRTTVVNNRFNATAFGYYEGQDLGGTNAWIFYDTTAASTRMNITNTGTVNTFGNLNANGGLSIGGAQSWTTMFTGSGGLTFGSTSAQTSNDQTIALNGIAEQDVCIIGPVNAMINANSTYTCWTTANTVHVRFNNYSSGSINPGTGNFKVTVIHF